MRFTTNALLFRVTLGPLTASSEVGTIYDDSFNVTTREVTDTSFLIIVNRVDGDAWGQGVNVHWAAFE